MKRIEDWEALWSGPSTRADRAAPWLSLGLAVLVALLA
jgi:hypothetical protein